MSWYYPPLICQSCFCGAALLVKSSSFPCLFIFLPDYHTTPHFPTVCLLLLGLGWKQLPELLQMSHVLPYNPYSLKLKLLSIVHLQYIQIPLSRIYHCSLIHVEATINIILFYLFYYIHISISIILTCRFHHHHPVITMSLSSQCHCH